MRCCGTSRGYSGPRVYDPCAEGARSGCVYTVWSGASVWRKSCSLMGCGDVSRVVGMQAAATDVSSSFVHGHDCQPANGTAGASGYTDDS